MKAYWIRADLKKVEAVDYEELSDLQRMVGGLITPAHCFPNGDIIFVDDEGLLKRQQHFFIVTGGNQPYAGNGVLVGRESSSASRSKTAAPKTAIADLRRLLTFASLAEVAHSYGTA